MNFSTLTAGEIKEVLKDVPDNTPCRMIIEEGLKQHPFPIIEAKKFPVRDNHGKFQKIVSFVVELQPS